MDASDLPDGWFPLPPSWGRPDRRVVTRSAHDDTVAWFPVPDPNGYAGIGLALVDKSDGAREFWMWTDDSDDRMARVIRLGYRRYVVELHGADICAVVEDPRRAGSEHRVTDDERDVLGHRTVTPAQVLTSSVVAESCARMWLDHGLLHEGYVLGPWTDR